MAVDNNKAVIKADVIEYYSSLYPLVSASTIENIFPIEWDENRCLPDTYKLKTSAFATIIIQGQVKYDFWVFVREENKNTIPLGQTSLEKLVPYSFIFPKIKTTLIFPYVNVEIYHMDGKTKVTQDASIGTSIKNNIGTITYATDWPCIYSPSSFLTGFRSVLAVIGEEPGDDVVLMSHTPTKTYSFTDTDGVSYYYPSVLNNMTLVSGSSATAPTNTVDVRQQNIVFTKPNKITINGNENTTTYAYKLNSKLVDGYINLVDMLSATGTSSGQHLISTVRLGATIPPNVDMTVVISDMLNGTYTFNIAANSMSSQTITNWKGGANFSISSYSATNSGDTLIYGYKKGSGPKDSASL